MPPTIGIDLGTTNSCTSIWANGKVQTIPDDLNNKTVPSYLSFSNSKCFIGFEAKTRAFLNPKNTVHGILRFLGQSCDDSRIRNLMKAAPFKMTKGNGSPSVQIDIDGDLQTFAPEELLCVILKDLRNNAEAFLNTKVEDAVICVTSTLNRMQLFLIKEAALAAGLKTIRLLSSQKAAALAYAFQNNDLDNERKILLVDVGGAQTVATLVVVDGPIVENVGSSGIDIGGDDFDQRILNFLLEEFQAKFSKDLRTNLPALTRLRTEAEAAKIRLTFSKETSLEIPDLDGVTYRTTLTRRQLEDLCCDLFWDLLRPVEDLLASTNSTKTTPKDVVLVGGSSSIPKIQQVLQDFFGRNLNATLNPLESASFGCAILAAASTGCEDDAIQDVLLIDSTPLPIGLETAGGVMTRMIERNTFPPFTSSKTFTTFNDDEDIITILIYEGSSTMTRYNLLLGSLTITGIPPCPRGVPRIEVTFSIDENFVLTVGARELTVGNFGETIIRDVKIREGGEGVVGTQLVPCR